MVTIYEVAKLAGVAPKTAARILAGATGRPYNQEKVMTAAQTLGYVRNQGAANLRSGKSGLIGVMVPNLDSPTYPLFFERIHEEMLGLGYQLLLVSCFGQVQGILQALRTFETNRVAGIVLMVNRDDMDEESTEIIRRLVARDTPIILMGRNARGLPVDEIVLNNLPGVTRAVHHLVKAGHTRIGLINGGESRAARERRAGWLQGMKDASLAADPRWISDGEWTTASGREQALRMLATSGDRPTAVFAASDELAVGVMMASRELGLSLPADLAIIGVDDHPMAQLVTPMLTTVRQPHDEIARACAKLLASRIKEGSTKRPRKLLFEPELIVRESA